MGFKMTIDILPTDLHGNKPSNRKIEIVNPVNPKGNGYVVCPQWGAFYTDSLVIRDSNNIPLVKGVDYNVAYLYEEYTKITASEVMGLILISPTVTPPFKVDAQYIGGELFVSTQQIKEAIEDILNSSLFKFSFWDILNRPTEFVPSHHQHEMWQLLGMKTTVDAVNEINSALQARLQLDNPLKNTLESYADRKIQEVSNKLDTLSVLFNQHYSDYTNPHYDNKDNLNLYNLNNWQLANNTESLDSYCDYRYQSVYGVYTRINNAFDYTQHLAAVNPHQTTINDLGGLTKTEWDLKFTNYLGFKSNVASNSLTMQNNTLDDIYSMVGNNLDASSYTGDTIEPRLLGSNYSNVQLSILCSDQTYRTLSDMFNNYPVKKNQIIYLGYYDNKTLVEAALNAQFNAVAVSTIAMANVRDDYPFNYLQPDLVTPLDTTSATVGNLITFIKTNTGWTEI